MGILVSFLSCQKDADKACPYLNTTEKHVNDLGVPIQTCGEAIKDSVVISETQGLIDSDGTDFGGLTTTSNGFLTIYNDYQYVYFETIELRRSDIQILSYDETIEYQPEYQSDRMWKISIQELGGVNLLKIKYLSDYSQWLIYGDEVYSLYSYVSRNVTRFNSSFTYKISPCCNPNE
ncbi:hypothetical protein D3C72_1361610 [compost metagenome]